VHQRVGSGQLLDDRVDVGQVARGQLDSEVAQVLGYTILLYRARPEDPEITLP